MSDNLQEPTFDTEAARKVLEAEKQERARRAGKRIEEVLQEERCQLLAMPQIANGSIVASVMIEALD